MTFAGEQLVLALAPGGSGYWEIKAVAVADFNDGLATISSLMETLWFAYSRQDI